MKLVLLGILSLKSYEQSPNNKTYFKFSEEVLYTYLIKFLIDETSGLADEN